MFSLPGDRSQPEPEWVHRSRAILRTTGRQSGGPSTTMRRMDELIERARRGDSAALAQVLETVAPAIHRFGVRMCKNAHDADDVLQDTLMSIAEHLADFEGRSSLSSWVFALTRSACARRRRGLKNRPTVAEPFAMDRPDLSPTPEQQAVNRELSQALSRALSDLPDTYREVILLRDVEGLTAPETADALGVSLDAVKSRLHRAREALRISLRPQLEPSRLLSTAGCPT